MGFLSRLFPAKEASVQSTPKSEPEPQKGRGTRPDGTNWWQVRERLPNGLVIEQDPYGNERYRWTRKNGTVMTAREKPKTLD